MTDILLLVIIVLQFKILHNQRKATNPDTESFMLWMAQVAVAVSWILFLLWVYHRWFQRG